MRLEGESAKALLLSSCTSDRPSIDVSPRSPLFIHNCACQEAHPALSNETTKVRSAGVLAVATLMRPATLREGVLRTPYQELRATRIRLLKAGHADRIQVGSLSRRRPPSV